MKLTLSSLLMLLVNADFIVKMTLTTPKDCTSTPFNLFFNHTATSCTDTNSLKSYLSQCRANPETPAIVCTPTIPSFYALLKQYHPASSFININHHSHFSPNSPTNDAILESVHDPHDTCNSDILSAFGYLTDYCLETEHTITKYIVNNTWFIYQVFYQNDQKGCVGEITRRMKHRWHDVDECFNYIQAIYYENKGHNGWFSWSSVFDFDFKVLTSFIVLVVALYYSSDFWDLVLKWYTGFRGRNSAHLFYVKTFTHVSVEFKDSANSRYRRRSSLMRSY